MTTALPSVHRGSCMVLSPSSSANTPQGAYGAGMLVNPAMFTHGITDEGDLGSGFGFGSGLSLGGGLGSSPGGVTTGSHSSLPSAPFSPGLSPYPSATYPPGPQLAAATATVTASSAFPPVAFPAVSYSPAAPFSAAAAAFPGPPSPSYYGGAALPQQLASPSGQPQSAHLVGGGGGGGAGNGGGGYPHGGAGGHGMAGSGSPPGYALPSGPGSVALGPGGPSGSQTMQLPSTPEGLHRFVRDRVQAVSRGPLTATAAFASPAPYSMYQAGPPRSASPEALGPGAGPGPGAGVGPLGPQFRAATIAKRPATTANIMLGHGGGAGAAGGGSGGVGGRRPSSPPSGSRMITHDAFVSRPATSTPGIAVGGDRRRAMAGNSRDLGNSRAAAGPATAGTDRSGGGGGGGSGGPGGGGSGGLPRTSAAGGGAGQTTPVPWPSVPNTPPGGGGGGGGGGSRGRARGRPGGPITIVRAPSSPPRDLETLQVQMQAQALALAQQTQGQGQGQALTMMMMPASPGAGSGRRSPSPGRLLQTHPHLGTGAVSLLTAAHPSSRAQIVAQARGVERLLSLDVEEVLMRASTPRQVATLTPGSLDGMGHPILLGADGARIFKRIPDHQPRFAAERLSTAAPLRLEQLGLTPGQGLDPDLDVLPYSPDGVGGGAGSGAGGAGPGGGPSGDGDASSDDGMDYTPQRSSAPRLLHTAGALPYTAAVAAEAHGGALSQHGGGGGGIGRHSGGGPVTPRGARASLAGGGVGISPQRLARSWSSPSRQPRAGIRASTATVDGAGGGNGGSGAVSNLGPESSRASRIGGDPRASLAGGGPGGGAKGRPGTRSPPPPAGAASGADASGAGGREVSPPKGSVSLSQAEDTSSVVVQPKWLGTYVPKEDPLGLWTGKRMNKTEVIVEKRLFAMRHNPGMRLELESRAAEALRQKAAVQAEMAAVTRMREEEALARKAQLKAEIEARRRGFNARDTERSRSRNRGLTREAKAALERQLLAEAAAEPRGPLTRDEAATIIKASWRMYRQRRLYLHIRQMVVRIQRAARLRYCVVRSRRRRAAAAELLLSFLQAIGGTRAAHTAMDLRELHSNYLRRRLLEKKGDLRHQTAVAVLVREWEQVESRILGNNRTRSLKGSALAAMAAMGFKELTGAAAPGSGGAGGGGGAAAAGASGAGHGHGPHHARGAGGAGGGDKGDFLSSVAGDVKSAGLGTRLLGQALQARKKGVMLLGGGKDLNKQLTVEYAVAHAMASDRVTLPSRQPVPPEVKAVVAACYLEHKGMAFTALIGIVWKRRARWFGMFNQQRHMAMARSVVATGSAWQAMDAMARDATEELVGPLPVLPRMRTTATLRELRAMMQTGVQEADLFTSYMLKGGIHELERKLHSTALLRASFGHVLHRNREPGAGPGASSPSPSGSASPSPAPPRLSTAGGGGGGGGGGNSGATSPSRRRPSGPGVLGSAGVDASGRPSLVGGNFGLSPSAQLPSLAESPRAGTPRTPLAGAGRSVRIDTSSVRQPSPLLSPSPQGPPSPSSTADPGGPGIGLFNDTASETGSEMTVSSTLAGSVLGAPRGGAGGGRQLAAAPSAKVGVAQLRERWWRDAVVRVDACLRKRYKQNGVSLVISLEDRAAPSVDLFAAKLAEINANPERAEALLAALPGGMPGGAGASGGASGGGAAGSGGGGGGGMRPRRGSGEGGGWPPRGGALMMMMMP